MSEEKQIGFHQGALTTLIKEKEALMNMLNVVDQLINMHSKGLSELGVDVQNQSSAKEKEPRKKKMPIEDIL